MSDFERDEIIYEEGWRDNRTDIDIGTPAEEVPVDEAAAGDAEASKGPIPLLISIQLGLFLVTVLVILLLKAMDSAAYHEIMSYYKVEMNKPVISQELFESIDLIGKASKTEVDVKASADELPVL